MTDQYHVSLEIVGLLYLPMAVSTIIGSMIYKYLQRRIQLRILYTYGNLVAACGILLFAVTNAVSLIGMSFALVLYGMMIGVITPLYSTMLTNEFEYNRGSAIGMFNFVRYIGMAMGPVISGLFLAHLKAIVVFGVLGGVFVLVSLLVLPGIYARTGAVREKN
ncbi:MFS transporter [Brevibacillus humidisoli]|uniref:MFS transporter n=1 Tax=Brevibacillus humidisoli TaxID=2895522 RepID=UPI001E351610|nr:MFS transporter [Brevibacillus humidisoli]UFJ42640.1 MFS transporter [Brevibacillus humidisoli]